MAEATRIRVLIVDDHAVVRTGLAMFLLAFDDLELVGAAANGAEALRLCAETRPDVVLMDQVMPEMDGASATRAIRQKWPHVQVVALTSFQEGKLVQEALQAGAIGYLLKNVSADELANAIRAAHAGRPTLAPEAAQSLVYLATDPVAPEHSLTSREREVLALMVKGLSNAEMAKHLTVSSSTIKAHVSSILLKLGVGTRTQAVALALQRHWVT